MPVIKKCRREELAAAKIPGMNGLFNSFDRHAALKNSSGISKPEVHECSGFFMVKKVFVCK